MTREWMGNNIYRSKLVRRDSDFGLMWETTLAPNTHLYVQSPLVDMYITPEGDFVTVSSYIPTDNPTYQTGCFSKISASGEMMWMRSDTALIDHYGSGINYFNGSGILSSGSIVAFGRTVQNPPGVINMAWLIKIDRNGCIDTLMCAPTTSGSEEAPAVVELSGATISFYPNPVRETLYWQGLLIGQDARVQLWDLHGRLVHTRT